MPSGTVPSYPPVPPFIFIISIFFFVVLFLFLPADGSALDDVERDQMVFSAGGYNKEERDRHHHRQHHRQRRAPAVWGEPAPDYSAVSLADINSPVYLYALLFVDLKTSDHYRREHAVARREVMRLANEANQYFFQINVRLLIVDIMETFRDDLSLYSFEQYRNQRLGQLPFHNFAVLVSYRYAGGLAFVGGMCTGRNVMMAGFYPHNPEAMGSIFFHEVAHLIGVPHRPVNESFAMPNCACPRRAHTATGTPRQQHPQAQQMPSGVSSASVIVSNESNLTGADGSGLSGCLKIPGFDHDCSLQWMVNLLRQRNGCLSRERRPNATSLALCGNGVVEAGEQCDCGPLERLCDEWANCVATSCSHRWPLWTMWALISALSVGLCLLPPLGWLYLLRRKEGGGHKKTLAAGGHKLIRRLCTKPRKMVIAFSHRQRRRRWMMPFWMAKTDQQQPTTSSSSKLLISLASATTTTNNSNNRWKRQKGLEASSWSDWSIWAKLKEFGQNKGNIARRPSFHGMPQGIVQRPTRPPPPPPSSSSGGAAASTFTLPRAFTLRSPYCSSSAASHCSSEWSTLKRPKMAPPPVPPANSKSVTVVVVRPKAFPPPAPTKRRKLKEEEDVRAQVRCTPQGEDDSAFAEPSPYKEEEDEEEDEWGDYCE